MIQELLQLDENSRTLESYYFMIKMMDMKDKLSELDRLKSLLDQNERNLNNSIKLGLARYFVLTEVVPSPVSKTHFDGRGVDEIDIFEEAKKIDPSHIFVLCFEAHYLAHAVRFCGGSYIEGVEKCIELLEKNHSESHLAKIMKFRILSAMGDVEKEEEKLELMVQQFRDMKIDPESQDDIAFFEVYVMFLQSVSYFVFFGERAKPKFLEEFKEHVDFFNNMWGNKCVYGYAKLGEVLISQNFVEDEDKEENGENETGPNFLEQGMKVLLEGKRVSDELGGDREQILEELGRIERNIHNNYSKALEYYEKILQLNPTRTFTISECLDITLELINKKKEENIDTEILKQKAMALAEKKNRLDGGSYDYKDKFNMLKDFWGLERAEKYLEELWNDPDIPKRLVCKVFQHIAKQFITIQHEEEEENFGLGLIEKILEFDPNWWEAYSLKGISELYKQNYEQSNDNFIIFLNNYTDEKNHGSELKASVLDFSSFIAYNNKEQEKYLNYVYLYATELIRGAQLLNDPSYNSKMEKLVELAEILQEYDELKKAYRILLHINQNNMKYLGKEKKIQCLDLMKGIVGLCEMKELLIDIGSDTNAHDASQRNLFLLHNEECEKLFIIQKESFFVPEFLVKFEIV